MQGQPQFQVRKQQTKTPEFRKWFKDSKVVDKKGEPLVVYYGSVRGKVSQFHRKYGTRGSLGIAYFTDDIYVARQFAELGGLDLVGYLDSDGIPISKKEIDEDWEYEGLGKRYPSVMSVYLKIENPLYLNDFNLDYILKYFTKRELVDDYILPEKHFNSLEYWGGYDNAKSEEDNYREFYERLDEELAQYSPDEADIPSLEFIDDSFNIIAGDIHFAKEFYKRSGYDGLIYEDAEAYGITYVPFFSNQIKSATENIGTFDPSKPDITMQVRGDERVEKKAKEYDDKIPLQAQGAKIEGERGNWAWILDGKTVSPSFGTKVKARDYSQNRMIRMRESAKIQMIIKYVKQGARLKGYDIKDLHKEITKYARQQLPTGSAYTKSQITQLLAKIRDAKDIKTLEDAYDKINTITESVVDKRNRASIKKLMDIKPRKKGGRVEGTKLTAEGYDLLAQIRDIAKYNEYEVSDAISAIMDMVERRNAQSGESGEDLNKKEETTIQILSVFGDLKNKSGTELVQALNELENITENSEMLATIKSELIRSKHLGMQARTEDVITGGKGLKGQMKGEREKIKPRFTRLWADRNLSWEWLLDKMSKYDQGSKPLESYLNKTFVPLIFKARYAESSGLRSATDMIQGKLMEIYKVKSPRALKRILDNNSKPVKTGIFVIQGGKSEELLISQNQMYKKWLEWMDPTLRETMESEEMGFNDEIMAQIEEKLTPEIKKWALWQINEFYPQYYASVNKVYREMFNVDLAFNPYYTPIYRDVSQGQEDPQFLNGNTQYASVVDQHLKSRVANKNPLRLMDGDSVLMNHIVGMEHFKAWAGPMRTLRAVLGHRRTQKAIEQYHGPTSKWVVNRFMNDFARGGMDRQNSDLQLDKWRASFTKAVIGANPTIFLKQLASIPAYSMDIPRSAFAKGVADFVSHPMKAYETLMKSEVMIERYRVGFERDIKLALQKTTAGRMSGAKNMTDALMILVKLGDKAAILAGGWSVYKYHHDIKISEGATEAEANEFALEKFGVATNRAQQSTGLEDLGDFQRSSSLARVFTMFMTAPNQYYRAESGAIRNIIHGRGSKADNMYRIFVTHILLPGLFQWMASGMPGVMSGWDDKDKQRMYRALLVGSFNGILVAGDIIEALASAAFGELNFGSELLPLESVIDDGQKILGRLGRAQRKDQESGTHEELVKAIIASTEDVVSLSSKFAGVPYDPLSKSVKQIYKTIKKGGIEDKEDVIRLLGYSDWALGNRGKKKALPKNGVPKRKVPVRKLPKK